MMVIYEVNLSIDSDIVSQFYSWLKEHVKEMLQFQGFIQATILKPEQEKNEGQEQLTVQYQVKDRGSLEHYLTHFAAKMRENTSILFKNKFSVERRILEIKDNVLK